MTLLYLPRSRGRQHGVIGLSGFWEKAVLCLCGTVLVLGTGLARAQLNALEQGSNGTSEVPVSAVDWVSSTITAQRGHYVEGSSIPYRLILSPLIPGNHRVVIAWDTKVNGQHNIDYLTHYNRLLPHNQFGAHTVPETIQPTRSLSGGFSGPQTFAIPPPSGVPGSNNSPPNQRELHIFNGTITSAVYVSEGSLGQANAETRLAIEFNANETAVAILFGGHLATKADWGTGQTASSIAGQQYRMRVVEVDGLPSLLNVAVDASAVVAPPTCDIAGPDPVCPGTTNTYAASSDVPGASLAWTFTANTAGAWFMGPNTGPAVQVYAGTGGGSYNLQVSVTAGPLQSACSRAVSVLTNVTTTALGNVSVCAGSTANFGTLPSGTGPFSFRWSKDGQVIEGQTSKQLTIPNVTAAAAGRYCVEVAGACGLAASCANLNVLSNTTATPLANLSRCAGEAAVFSTTAGGVGPFRYRWLKNGNEILGQTNRALNVGTLGLNDAGTYTVEVYGQCNAVTNSGTLTVAALPPCNILGPSMVCPSSAGSVFTAPANFAGYIWRVTGNGTIMGRTNEAAVVVGGTTPGFLTLNLTVVNSNGCSRTCARTITVGDAQPPTITCPANIQTNTAPGQCSRTVTFNVVASDDCGTATVTCTPATGAEFQKGTTTVNCTAADGAGNQASCSFAVTVLDLEKPVLTFPTNLVVNTGFGTCDAQVNYGVFVSDNCPGAILTCAPPNGTVFPLGVSGVTCRGTDAAGNSATCAFEVTVVDLEGPQVVCPGDMRFMTDPGQCDVMVEYQAQATDNCAMADLVCVPPSGSLFSPGITLVICTASDVSHNVSHCYFEVEIDDGEKPRMVCPPDISVFAEPGRCDALVNYSYKAGDNCRDVMVDCVPPPGSRFPIGQTNVTCTAVDDSGNTATCSFRVTVSDNQRPTLSCPQDITVNTGVGRCSAVVQYTNAVSDNCAGARVDCVPPAGSTFSVGLTVVNCLSTDRSSNSVSCAFNVVVQDGELPTLTCPDRIITNAPAGQCLTAVNFNAVATDNCPGVQVFCSPESGDLFPIGENWVLCVALDASGNVRDCAFSVTVSDNDPPMITCPTNQIVAADSGRCDAAVSFSPVFSDNCGGAALVCTPPSGSRFVVGETPVSCTATDTAGNSNQCTFSVLVRDQQHPQIICPADILTNTAPGTCDALVSFTATVLDNCAGATLHCVPPSGSRFTRGPTVVACTATDASGNVTACAFTITVKDSEAPIIACPANILTNTAPGRCDAMVTFTMPLSDNCPGATVSCTPASGSTFARGVTAVNCVATDASGNTNRCAFTVAVEDRQKPVITCPQPQVLFTSLGHCDAMATFTASATDNCEGTTVSCLPPSGTRFAKGVSPVTCTATDASGNTESCWFTVTVRDIDPPVLTCPTNIISASDPGRCDALITFAATVADECAGAIVVCVPPPGTRFAHGTTPVNCTATDTSSNGVTCAFTVQVLDRESPRLACPADITTNAGPGLCSAEVTFAVSVTDNCPGATFECFPPSGSAFPIGTNSVVCIGTDSSANQDVCVFNVIVRYIEKPVISCPANITINTEPGRCDALATFVANATDNCLATLVCSPTSGTRFSKGVTPVTCTATDPSGNTAICSFTITVNDNEPPAILCPTNMVLHTVAEACAARAIFSPQVTDNCPGASVVCIPPSGTDFPVGTTTVACQATDASGNTRSCAFDVAVIDTEPPRLTCPGDLTVDTEPTQCTATVPYPVSASDACGLLSSVVCVPPSGSLFVKGTTAVHCTVRDASGNEAACAFNVTVRDTEAPMLACPTNITVSATLGRCDAPVSFDPSFSDNCPGATLVCTPQSGSAFLVGTTVVRCVATDTSGNTNQCSFNVRVIDTQKPVLTCSSNIAVSAESNRCDAVVTFAISVTDNCAVMSMQCTPSAGSRFALGTTPVTCSGVDAAGNVGTCSFTVTVRDTQKPILECPGDLVLPALTGRCDAPVTFVAEATDNCGTLGVSCFPPSGSVFSLGVTPVTCTAIDAALNSETCQFTVTVRDLEPPILQCPADIFANTVTGRCDAVVTFAPQASDNCSSKEVTCNPPSGTSFPKGTNAVTCTARDASNNSESCSFRVIVRDAEKPQVICPNDMVVTAETNECRARVSYSASATDNCPGVALACNPPNNSFFNKGVTSVICVATDTSGNTNRCSFSVTVIDVTPPAITCPANIFTNATHGQISSVVPFALTVTDNCPGVSYVCTPQSGSVFQRGTTPVTCTATDASGNTNRCSFTVTVNDTEPPVINCPTNLIVTTTPSRCDATVDYAVTASDNSQIVTVTCIPPSGSVLPKGMTNVLCTATDAASNRVSCSFTVAVVDLERPVIVCPSNIVAGTDRGRCDARVTYGPNATDNCGVASVTCNPPSGALFGKGTNVVTCTASDSSGNTESCSFTVRVVDYESPVITCPTNMVLVLPFGQCDLGVTYSPNVSDNCPGAAVSCVPPTGSIFGKGIVTVNCTGRDSSSNTATCSFAIDVRDQESPVITCPADIAMGTYPGSCGAPVGYSATVRDNCPGATLTCNPPSGSMMPVGTNLVTCSASDTSGNTASCTFRVTIRDLERPTLTCPGDIIIDGNNGTCSPVATFSPTVRDNCPGATVVCSPPSRSTFAQGTNRVQCTALDVNGNMSSCAFSVIVRLQPLTATPLDSQVRCAGETCTFSTTPTGSGPVAFAWFKDGVPMQGRTNSSLVLSNLTSASSGTYSVVVQNPCGSLTTSAPLQVNMPVAISGMTNVTRCDCDPLVLSPVVSGTGPFSYVWRKNGAVLPGMTSNTLAFPKVTTNDVGAYSVEVSGACNTTSASANVTVIAVPNPAIYTNGGPITIVDHAPAFPYPSSVHVVCVPRSVKRATVTLRGFSHGYPDDVDVLLAAPDGRSVMLMSDAGDGAFANNVTLTFDDSAALPIPDGSQLISGTFRTGNYDTDSDAFPSPAPKLAPAGTLSSLAGSDANGFWSLFVVDDFQLDGGSINNGWILRLYWESSQVVLASPRVMPGGAFQMTIAGDAGATYAIEASTDLVTWRQIATVTLSGPQYTFTDSSPPKACFYRAVQR